LNITIKDIAKTAGVSPSTVSRVLTGNVHVSEEALSRVKQAVEKLGYRPNALARSLVSKRSRTIGLIIPEIGNPFYAEIISGVEKAATRQDYGVLLISYSPDNIKKDGIQTLLERRVDGIIHAGPFQNDKLVPRLKKEGFPFVLVGRKIGNLETNCVIANDRHAAYQAAMHLLNLNHKIIGFIFGNSESYSSLKKLEGFKAALAEKQIAFREELMEPGYLEFSGGYEAALSLLKKNPRPTAILAGNDVMALGAREAILEMGLNIPRDIALVGFDDIPWASLKGLELTTMSVPRYKMGYLACDLLINKINRPDDHEVEEIVLEPEIKIRKSCGYFK